MKNCVLLESNLGEYGPAKAICGRGVCQEVLGEWRRALFESRLDKTKHACAWLNCTS